MKARIGRLGKLDCLCSKKKSLQQTNNRFLTSTEPFSPVTYDLPDVTGNSVESHRDVKADVTMTYVMV